MADKQNWAIEVPGNADPYEDQFEKAAFLKKENVAKNEFKRLRNIARARKVKIPSVGVTGNMLAQKKEVSSIFYFG